MKFLSELINTLEEGIQVPINRPKNSKLGVIAVLDRGGMLDYESAYAFTSEVDAQRMEKFLEQTLEDEQVIVEECADGKFVVLSLRQGVNASQAEFLCFADTEENARELVQDLIEDQKLYNVTDDDLEDLDFIKTTD